jgi:hypothetical protein
MSYKKYIGTKVVDAMPEIKDGMVGYSVKYKDGYISWSPANAFEEAYTELGIMSFSAALIAIRDGVKVRRNDWDHNVLYLVKSMEVNDNSFDLVCGNHIETWEPNMEDILCNDWVIVKE